VGRHTGGGLASIAAGPSSGTATFAMGEWGRLNTCQLWRIRPLKSHTEECRAGSARVQCWHWSARGSRAALCHGNARRKSGARSGRSRDEEARGAEEKVEEQGNEGKVVEKA
jgi:hypothetical protein